MGLGGWMGWILLGGVLLGGFFLLRSVGDVVGQAASNPQAINMLHKMTSPAGIQAMKDAGAGRITQDEAARRIQAAANMARAFYNRPSSGGCGCSGL